MKRGLAAVAAADARVVVLGTLPSDASIERGEYYSQPRNVFWRIAGDLFGFAFDAPYEERVRELRENRVAIWDVCLAAKRQGSLDSEIVRPVVNEFEQFLLPRRQIRLIAFNGSTAGQLYRRLVAPGLPSRLAAIPQRVVPSTSPALAAMSYGQKLDRWRIIAAVARGGSS